MLKTWEFVNFRARFTKLTFLRDLYGWANLQKPLRTVLVTYSIGTISISLGCFQQEVFSEGKHIRNGKKRGIRDDTSSVSLSVYDLIQRPKKMKSFFPYPVSPMLTSSLLCCSARSNAGMKKTTVISNSYVATHPKLQTIYVLYNWE